MENFCNQCGEKVTGNFCSNCGTKIIDEKNFQIGQNTEQPIEQSKKKIILKKWWFWTIIGVVLIAVVTVSIVLISASNSSSSNSGSSYNSYNDTVSSESEAINKVKNYYFTEDYIAKELGFNSFYSPDYGVCDASQKFDGSWEVKLKGNMSGYIDDYNSEFRNYDFSVTATVSETGSVSSVKAYKMSF